MAYEPLIAKEPHSQIVCHKGGRPLAAPLRGTLCGWYETIRLFGNEAIRLLEAHRPWNVNLVDF